MAHPRICCGLNLFWAAVFHGSARVAHLLEHLGITVPLCNNLVSYECFLSFLIFFFFFLFLMAYSFLFVSLPFLSCISFYSFFPSVLRPSPGSDKESLCPLLFGRVHECFSIQLRITCVLNTRGGWEYCCGQGGKKKVE